MGSFCINFGQRFTNFFVDPEKLATAEKYRTEGNEYFKTGDLKKAMGAYHNALMYLKVIQAVLFSREF